MGVFDSIKHAIFGDHGPLGMFNQDEKSPAQAPQQSAASRPAIPMNQAATAPTSAVPAPATPTRQPVDVEAILTQKAAAYGKANNWRSSIVDLLTLLGLDSSLQARKELANELNIHAGADGSAEQNVALHKAVMQQLAQNGGKVPAELTS